MVQSSIVDGNELRTDVTMVGSDASLETLVEDDRELADILATGRRRESSAVDLAERSIRRSACSTRRRSR